MSYKCRGIKVHLGMTYWRLMSLFKTLKSAIESEILNWKQKLSFLLSKTTIIEILKLQQEDRFPSFFPINIMF